MGYDTRGVGIGGICHVFFFLACYKLARSHVPSYAQVHERKTDIPCDS